MLQVWQLGQECEANPPYLQQTDAWGHRIDKLVTCPGNVLYSYYAVLSKYCEEHSRFQKLGFTLHLLREASL